MIDRRSAEPLFRQLAAILRGQIATGVLRPGERLPAEKRLAQEYGVGLDTAANAVALLRNEGLVITRSPQGSFVRQAMEEQEFSLQRGSRVVLRMPTPEERAEFDLDEGVPVAVVIHGARTRVFPGDRWTFVVK